MKYYMALNEQNQPKGWMLEPTGGYIEVDESVYLAFSVHPEYIWNGTEAVAPPEPEPYVPAPEEIVAQFEQQIDNYINIRATEKGYDSRITVCIRTGYPSPWQQECITFAIWMDDVYVHCYQVMADVQAGLRAIPTIEELIAELPVLTW